jgi:predicted methyltransferase
MRHTLLALTACLLLSPQARAQDPLAQAIAAPTRTAKLVARDPARHPQAELAFFGVTPRSDVVEIWPGGGYWTEILAPYLHASGDYDIAVAPASGGGREDAHFVMSPSLQAKLASNPSVYGRVHVSTLGQNHDDFAPPNSIDLVLTFRNLHNWMGQGDAPEMLAAIHRALKPGGILGIEDHRARPDRPQDTTADNGYVRQDYAVHLIEKAGFKLVASSDIDANPRDTTDWPKGVWTLPPVLAMGNIDRAKYQAIGEADNFVLKFRKTAP